MPNAPDLLHLDYRSGVVTFTAPDGTVVHRSVMDPDVEPEFVSATFRIGGERIDFTTAAGENARVELPPVDGSTASLRGRPVVYLDQNMWRQLDDARNAPAKVRSGDLDATREIADRIKRSEIVVPISAGHMIETGPLYGDRRVAVATQLVINSGGWVMTHPVAIRRIELIDMFAREFGRIVLPPIPRFSLDHRLLSLDLNEPFETPPDPVGRFTMAVSGIQAIMEVLLERTAVSEADAEPGVTATKGWAEGMKSEATAIATDRVPLEHRRSRTMNRVLSDIAPELNEAAAFAELSQPDFDAWITNDAEQSIQLLPSTGRYREVLHHRLLNPGRNWLTSDLVDLVFLCCNAGYADHVVCEKRTGNDLRRIEDTATPGASIHTSMMELVDAL